ncbi:class I SAM-dependent methyltransferase [Actinokineospora sp. HUAS TT18]|uniref:class I SAM-dependent methyltransferase n=1 Tax=Actinokineospora sp. HUAS TT18 TaxID=3447451 RepID=UPI003F5224E1
MKRFYDELAADYHLIFADWDASITRQGAALDTIIRAQLGDQSTLVLDCACGVGTQAIGLAIRGYDVVGTDISGVAAARARREANRRGVRIVTSAADMRQLPFPGEKFDVVVCADNSIPHLLTATDQLAAFREMYRVLRPGGLLLVTTRDYDEVRANRPLSTAPQVAPTPAGESITFQLWTWHDDQERYDLRHFQLIPGDGWRVEERHTTYWALTRGQLTAFAKEAGFVAVDWQFPSQTGYYQPIQVSRKPAGTGLHH